MADEPSEGFKITDRRGRRQEEAAAEEPRSRETPAAPEGSPAEVRQQPDERSLVGLFSMLASWTLVALGEMADPVTGQSRPDLAQASETIDLLGLLHEKTEGNRTAEESAILDQILYDLHLRYVDAMKRSR